MAQNCNRYRLFGLLAIFLFSPFVGAEEKTADKVSHRILVGDYSKKLLAIIDEHGKTVWQHKINDIHDAYLLGNGNVLFQTDWRHLVEVTPDGKTVWQYDAGQSNGNSNRKVEVHAFQRLPGDVTMIAESGPGRIIEVDREGKLLKEIKLKLKQADPHRDTRLVRKLESGNYLVAHESEGAAREYDADGKVVWEYDAKTKLYSAVRLKNGNTLIGTGDGNRVIEVTPQGEVAWSVEKNDLPGITLAWITMVDRLPNGNTVIVNCHAGPENPQVIEVSPEKKVVWTFKDFDRFGNSLPVGIVLPKQKTGSPSVRN